MLFLGIPYTVKIHRGKHLQILHFMKIKKKYIYIHIYIYIYICVYIYLYIKTSKCTMDVYEGDKNKGHYK